MACITTLQIDVDGVAPRVEALTRETLLALYAARRNLPLKGRTELGLRLNVAVYFKDPLIAETDKDAAIDQEFTTPWEPGLRDGPTSASFAVVDFDFTTSTLTKPVIWDDRKRRFTTPDGNAPVASREDLHFHQISVWATVQNTLEFFEGNEALSRCISWAFEGSRLIVVPLAGFGENAYYDRDSKSLQFYWFEHGGQRIYTCLSSDIVNHELGHAVPDGIGPHYYESVRLETAAFHEFVGDLAAILMSFRNNAFRSLVLNASGDLDDPESLLGRLAPEFGEALVGEHSLRSGLDPSTMKTERITLEPHALSVVMKGAMYDVLRGIFRTLSAEDLARAEAHSKPPRSSAQILWNCVPTMRTLAIQPLDFLPPCAVSFRDYAIAVMHAEQLSNPQDQHGYRAMIRDIYVARGIFADADEAARLFDTASLYSRLALDVYHPIDAIAASRGRTYHFLNDNRKSLLIPQTADLLIPDVMQSQKVSRDSRALPDQIILQYLWREQILLDDTQFGRLRGQRTSMLCGGTLVFDENGNRLHWVRKPGILPLKGADADAEMAKGRARRQDLLDTVAQRLVAGMIGKAVCGSLGLMKRTAPPITAPAQDGLVRVRLAPHLSIHEAKYADESGEKQWLMSF